MSNSRIQHHDFSSCSRFSVLILIGWITLLSAASGALGRGSHSICDEALVAEIDATLRGFGATGTTAVRLDLPSAGIVTLEVSVPATAEVLPRLGLAPACGGAEPFVLERSATHLAFAVREGGTYFVRTAAQDPAMMLAEFKLTSHFLAAEVRDADIAMTANGGVRRRALRTDFLAAARTKNEDHEVDPDPLVSNAFGSLFASVVTLYGDELKNEDHEVDPDPKNEDHEVDPDPLLDGQDAGHALARMAFLYPTAFAKNEDHEVDPDPKNEDHEVDPDPLRSGPSYPVTCLVSFVAVPTKNEDHEVDPDPLLGSIAPPGDSAGEHRGRLVTFSVGGDSFKSANLDRDAVVRWIADLIWSRRAGAGEGFQLISHQPLSAAAMLQMGRRCLGATDDHGDTFSCATALPSGPGTAGEIGNAWGDDADVFEISLDESSTVRIAADEPVAILSLYDRFGQRLLAGESGLVRTLGPGRYFVRIEGFEGAYTLGLKYLDW